MNLKQLIFTNNACFKKAEIIQPKGILIHSTGINFPYLNYFCVPDDGFLGPNVNNTHWNKFLVDGQRRVCVHAFIGKLMNGNIATYQTLPWHYRGWHSGKGHLGTANDTHIGIEILEDDLVNSTYFNSVYKEAVELCAFLCKMFNLNPLKNGIIVDHFEAYEKNIAANHIDVQHWFPKHGKTMNTFRIDVCTKVKPL